MHPFLIFIMFIISIGVITYAYFFYVASTVIADVSKVSATYLEEKIKNKQCQEDFILSELEELKNNKNYALDKISKCTEAPDQFTDPNSKMINKILDRYDEI